MKTTSRWLGFAGVLAVAAAAFGQMSSTPKHLCSERTRGMVLAQQLSAHNNLR